MRKWLLSLSIAAGVIGLSACNNDNSEAIVKTDAGDITKEDFYNAMKEEYGESVLKNLIYEKVLENNYKVTDEEVNAELEKVKAQFGANFEMALTSNGFANEEEFIPVIKSGLLQQKAAVKDIEVTDEEVKEYYDNYKPEIKARHILVEDEKTAKEIKTKLDNGEKFEDLAKENSIDTGSAANGGDLGWFGEGKMVAEFEDAAYALDVDEISDPVETTNGFHIIQVTDKKEKGSFEEEKERMEFDLKLSKVTQETMTAALEREIKAADVSIKDKDLKSILDSTDTSN